LREYFGYIICFIFYRLILRVLLIKIIETNK
jgi:hypothetical protein